MSSKQKASLALEEGPRGLAKVELSPNEYLVSRLAPFPLCTHVPRLLIVAKRIGRQRGSAVERPRQIEEPRAGWSRLGVLS
jgi:hypothetical protein